MILTSLGKEFILVNEELAIYISFLIVLTILVTNFGEQIATYFSEQSNNIAENYSVGAQNSVQNLLNKLDVTANTLKALTGLSSYELSSSYRLLSLKEFVVKVISATEFKLV